MTIELTEDGLAADVHALWRHWMAYLFEQAGYDGRGLITLSAADSARWFRQAHTPFSSLPAHEQESDRQLARHLLDKWAQKKLALYHLTGRYYFVPLSPQPEPICNGPEFYEAGQEPPTLIGWRLPGRVSVPDVDFDGATSGLIKNHVLPCCPYGQAGDVIPAGPTIKSVGVVRLHQLSKVDILATNLVEELLDWPHWWDSHYGRNHAWQLNPWCWRLEFVT